MCWLKSPAINFALCHTAHILLLVSKHGSLERTRFFWKEIGSCSSTAVAVVWAALLEVWRSGCMECPVWRSLECPTACWSNASRQWEKWPMEPHRKMEPHLPCLQLFCLIVYYDPDLLPLRQRIGSEFLSPMLPGLHPQWPFPMSHSVLSPVERIEQLPKRLGLQMSSASCNLKERGKGI